MQSGFYRQDGSAIELWYNYQKHLWNWRDHRGRSGTIVCPELNMRINVWRESLRNCDQGYALRADLEKLIGTEKRHGIVRKVSVPAI